MEKRRKIPSPCIDVCEDIHGVCVGCGRRKKDKKAWKKAEDAEERLALVKACLKKTQAMGTQPLWLREYKRKCMKKDAEWVWDEVEPD